MMSVEQTSEKRSRTGTILTVIGTVAGAIVAAVTLLDFLGSSESGNATPSRPDSVVGRWQGTDIDGSTLTVEITHIDAANYKIVASDSFASLCDGAAITYVQYGTLSGNELKGENIIACPGRRPMEKGPFRFVYMYDPKTDQLHDSSAGPLARAR